DGEAAARDASASSTLLISSNVGASLDRSLMTTVPPTKSPIRLDSELNMIETTPIAYEGGGMKSKNRRNRLRTNTSKNLTGLPSSLITRSFMIRLPGVCPLQIVSNNTKYPQ